MQAQCWRYDWDYTAVLRKRFGDVWPFCVRAFAVAKTDAAEELNYVPLVLVCKLKKSDEVLGIVSLRELQTHKSFTSTGMMV